ncbi:MAG: tetratricopeptide repeat protein [Acidobacteriota bacterium]|nr:tetratricopeptide repeat protein [Acidobacteriota bacterium]
MDPRFRRAVEQAQAGRIAEAEASVRSLLSDHPSPDGYRLLGFICENQGKLDQAEQAYRESLKLNPGLEFSRIRLGIVFCKDKKYTQCVDWLQQLHPRIDAIPEALFYLCQALLETGQSSRALQVAAKMEQATRSDPEALLSVCRLLTERGLYRESVPLLTRSVERLPQSGEAHYLLALALSRTGRIDRVGPLLDKALLLQPNFVPALLLQAMGQLEAKKLSEAKQSLGKVLELQPKEPKAVFLLSKVMIDGGEYAEAIRSLKALIDRFPEDPDVHLLLLSAYRKDENYQKAFETSLDLLERFPDYPLVLYNGGLDLEIMGRFQEAETHLRKLLPMIQGDPELMAGARLGLARVLAHQKKTVESTALFEEAIRLNQGGVPALADLSDIYLKAGEFEKALKLLRQVVAREPKRKQAYIQLAKVLRRLGKIEEAREQIRIFQQLSRAEKATPKGTQAQQVVQPRAGTTQ